MADPQVKVPMAQDDWVIDIPGFGEVTFPATMSQEEVDAASAKLYSEHNAPEGFYPKAGDALTGVKDRLAEIGTGLYEGLKERSNLPPEQFVMGTGGNQIPAIFESLKESAEDVISGNPRRMGQGAVDAALLATPVKRGVGAVARGTGAALESPVVSTAIRAGARNSGGIMGMLNAMREQVASTLNPPRLVRKVDPLTGRGQMEWEGFKGEPEPVTPQPSVHPSRYVASTGPSRGPSAAGQQMAPVREPVVEAPPEPVKPQKSIHERGYIPSTGPVRAGRNPNARPAARPYTGGPSIAEAEEAIAGGASAITGGQAGLEALFKRLSQKNVLTTAEANQLEALRKIMKGRASNAGLGYAAR